MIQPCLVFFHPLLCCRLTLLIQHSHVECAIKTIILTTNPKLRELTTTVRLKRNKKLHQLTAYNIAIITEDGR